MQKLLTACSLFFFLPFLSLAQSEPCFLPHPMSTSRMSGEGYVGIQESRYFIAASVANAADFQIDLSLNEAATCFVARVSNNAVPLRFQLVDSNGRLIKRWNFEHEFFAFHHLIECIGTEYATLQVVAQDDGALLYEYTLKKMAP